MRLRERIGKSARIVSKLSKISEKSRERLVFICLLILSTSLAPFGMIHEDGKASSFTEMAVAAFNPQTQKDYQSPSILMSLRDKSRIITMTTSEPILIEGNDDFAQQAAAKGWPGDGSAENPYIIENLQITATEIGQNAMEIRETDVHFIIRNCIVSARGVNPSYSAIDYPSGIFLYKVSNGIIENNIVLNNTENGIFVMYSTRLTFINNLAFNNGKHGFYFGGSFSTWNVDITAINNTAYNNVGDGFHARNNDRIKMKDNRAFGNEGSGFAFMQVENATFLFNIASFNGESGFYIELSENVQLMYNYASTNLQHGFFILESSHVSFQHDESAYNQLHGIYLLRSENITVINNNLKANNNLRFQAYSDTASNVFDHNFYSNHVEPDFDGDGIVDVPYVIDGDGNLVDEHPVTTPHDIKSEAGIETNIAEETIINLGNVPSFTFLLGFLALVLSGILVVLRKRKAWPLLRCLNE